MKIDRNRITLKRATKLDIEVIVEYRILFLNEICGQQPFALESRLRQSLKEYFIKSLESDTFISWIAEYENKPISFSGMVLREQPGNFEIPNGRTGYILNMFTIKEFRNNGLASLLFQKLLDEAKQKKLDRVELHATKDGEPIYRRFGFVEPHDKMLEFVIH